MRKVEDIPRNGKAALLSLQWDLSEHIFLFCVALKMLMLSMPSYVDGRFGKLSEWKNEEAGSIGKWVSQGNLAASQGFLFMPPLVCNNSAPGGGGSSGLSAYDIVSLVLGSCVGLASGVTGCLVFLLERKELGSYFTSEEKDRAMVPFTK